MQITKEHLVAKHASLHQQLAATQQQFVAVQANLEALSGAIKMTELLIGECDKPEEPSGIHAVPPPASEGEA